MFIPKRARLSSSRCSKSLLRGLVAASIGVAAATAPTAQAQSVPIAFANTYAGGGPVCSSSLPVYALSGAGAKYGDGCLPTQATFNAPVAVASDSLGNLFIADQNDMLVRVVYNGGTALATAIAASNVQNPGLLPIKGNIYTIAGGVTATPTGSAHYCNQVSGPAGTDTALDGCPASQSEQGPRGLAVDADGNIFISSVSPVSQVRVIYVAGTAVTKLITLANPSITSPQPGYVYNIAGGNASSFTGDGASAAKATMNTPRGLFIDANENVYVADQLNNVIRRIDSTTGFISTVAGHCVVSGTNCTATATSGDGSLATAAAVNIYSPYGITIDANGNLFIAEAGSATLPGRVRVVYAAGTLPGITGPTPGYIYTYAGGTSGTTPAQLATFQEVFGVSLDPAGFLYISDYRTATTGSNRIWRVDPTSGNIASIAGNGASALTTGNRCNGGTTGPTATDTRGDGCPATQAYLQNPQEGVAFDGRGNFYVDDRVNNVVRQFTYNNTFPATAVGSSLTQPLAFLYAAGSVPTAETFTTQGNTSADYADAGGDTCALNTALVPSTTCVDYVKFTPTTAGLRSGSVTVASATATIGTQTLTGIGSAPVLTITPGTAVTLGSAIQPIGISTDQLGNVNISDAKNKQLLRSTIAGATPTAYLNTTGLPRQSTTDSYGNLFVADSVNNNILERTSSGTTSTLGTGLSAPQGVAADQFGNLYIADTGNNRLVYLSPLTGVQRNVALSGFTLSAPTYLALDPAGDLFIIDTKNTRVVELLFAAGPQLVPLPTGITPSAIAFDPAGDIYFADTTTGSVFLQPAGASSTTTVVSNVTTLAGIAVGSNGNLFVADSSATAATGYNVSTDNSVFATTNIALTSLPITLTLSDVGNLSATLSTPPYTETGSAAAFPSTGTPTCTAAYVLAPGATCTQAFDFAPTVPNAQSARVVFSTTSAQSVTANLSGTATNLILTSTTITPLNATATYGQSVPYTVTLTPASTGTSAPTGSIAFVVAGKTVSSQTVSANPYTFTAQAPVGVDSVSASYSGDPLYAASNASTSITVSKATTTVAVTYSQGASGITITAVVTPSNIGPVAPTGNIVLYVDSVPRSTQPYGNGTVSTTLLLADGNHTYSVTYAGDSNYLGIQGTAQTFVLSRIPTLTRLTTPAGPTGFVLTATVTGTTGTGTPTGTVTFSNAGTVITTVPLVNGVATFTTATLNYASYSFSASYSGDGLYQPSTAAAAGDFFVVAPVTTLGVPEGGQAVETVSVIPINGYTGTLTAACSGLPVDTICRFLPTPVVLSTASPAALAIQVFSAVNPTVGSLSHPAFKPTPKTLFALLLLTPALFGLRRRKGLLKPSNLPRLLSLLLFATLATALVGCGNKTPANSPAIFSTPAGTYAITVTLTDANKLSRSALFNITVTQ